MITELSPADVAYVQANFLPLSEVCRERGVHVSGVRMLVERGRVPAATYLLPDGTEKMVLPTTSNL